MAMQQGYKLYWPNTTFQVLVFASAFGWVLLFFGGGPYLAVPALCTGHIIATLPSKTEFEYVLTWLSPGQLALSWTTMLFAMMLPVVSGPLSHVWAQSFRHDRVVASASFVLGYTAIWVIAAFPLIYLAVFLRLTTSVPYLQFVLAIGMMLIWQMMPWKQYAQNKCHSQRPLSAFGSTTFRSGTRYGVTHGFWCFTTCSPIMLAALAAPSHSLAWMIAATLWIWAERLESPRKPMFRLNVPLRALRAGHYGLMHVIMSVKLGMVRPNPM